MRELARAGVDPLKEDVRWDTRCLEVKTFKWIISKKNVYVPEQPSVHDSLYGRCLMHQHNCHITDDVPCDLRDGFPAVVFALNWFCWILVVDRNFGEEQHYPVILKVCGFYRKLVVVKSKMDGFTAFWGPATCLRFLWWRFGLFLP